jgi:hypothetical protein
MRRYSSSTDSATRAKRRRGAGRLEIALAAVAIGSLVVAATALLQDGDSSRPEKLAPAFDGSVRGEGSVMQTGSDGPVFCAPISRAVPAVTPHTPEQCVGIPIKSWDWRLVPWRQSAENTTWADVRVRGTYDDGVLTITGAPMEPLPDDEPSTSSLFSPLCGDPDGDPRHDSAEWEAATQDHPSVINSIGGMRAIWVSNPIPGPVVVNVIAVPGEADAVRRQIREVWQGLLCVEERSQPTSDELERIRTRLPSVLDQTIWQTRVDDRLGIVEALIDVVTPAEIAAVERAFGPGVVELQGVLTPQP